MRMIIKIMILIAALISFLSLSCSSGMEEGHDTEAQGENSIELHIADTIGVEIEDTNYVFGAIIDADYLPSGNIALLDVRRNRVSFFSPDGEFVSYFGREGNGPGEFAEPGQVAVLNDGRIAVSDNMHCSIIFFDSLLQYEGEISGFIPTPPLPIRGGSEGSVVGMQMHYYHESEKLHLGYRIASWDSSPEPFAIYWEDYIIPEDNTIEMYPPRFCTDSRGRIYAAPFSLDEYTFSCISTEGDTVFTLTEPYSRREKTQEEMEAEHMGYRCDTPGFDSNDRRRITARWSPEPIRTAITGLYSDSRDRLWVETGRRDSPSPLFEVYDSTGTHLATVQTDFGAQANNWSFIFGDSTALAFDTNPDDYSKVLILSIIDN